MPDTRALLQAVIQSVLILGTLAAPSAMSHCFGADDDVQFQQRRKRAQEALEERMQARFAAGWQPKSQDEQDLTRLRALQIKSELNQDKANRRSLFEAARAEVYMDMVKHYSRMGYYRRAYVPLYVRSRVTGVVYPAYRSYDFWVLDPFAARMMAHFGNRAARSKAIAAAQEYHANVYYERRLRNQSSRIAELQRKISLQAQLAQGP